MLAVGMVGYKFMGKAHSHAYHDLSLFFPEVSAVRRVMICGRDAGGVEEAARRFGFESFTTEWRELVSHPDIDVVDINAPSDVHKEIAIAAVEAGKHVLCEKPLAITLEDAREMLEAAEKAGVKHMVCFNYRFVPAVQLAKRLINEGRIGHIKQYRASFLQDWLMDENAPFVWRLDKKVAGSGAHGDLNAHVVDLARYLVGEFEEVIGVSRTFTKQRPYGREEQREVTVDDATAFLASFKSGAIGTFEASRVAGGKKCSNAFEVHGSKGSIRFDFERMNELELYLDSDEEEIQGYRRIQATGGCHPYMEAWWPAGHGLGFEHTFIHAVHALVKAIDSDEPCSPSFVDGVKCQQVLEAVDASIERKRWVAVEEM